jgi:hypothetical protein
MAWTTWRIAKKAFPAPFLIALGLAMTGVVPSTTAYALEAGPHTPATGSPERKAIFDAMRRLGDLPNRVFVVKYLKVQDGWAWTATEPKSSDGAQQYEPESALLHFQDGIWKVIDQPCGEEGCDLKQEIIRIRAANPKAPAGIFPKT